MLNNKEFQKLPVNVIIAVSLGLIAYMLFLITSSIYKDYQNEKHLLSLQKEIYSLNYEIDKQKSDVFYFSSPQFKDKFAKHDLGRLNPGEKMISFANIEENVYTKNSFNGEITSTIHELPKVEQWYEYFFGEKFVYNP